MVGTPSRLPDGSFLSDRYKIIKQIGRGGFGRTYLALDTSRYQEKCVLKEFAPRVERDTDLQKAEELFEREAGILYQLDCDRIPNFQALLRTRIDRKKSLFLVQEYIEGKTYYELLKERGSFTESEVIELILELLPVLEYIHEKNLIHRDISPDNLIYRDRDKKPVLIDFGCVKLAANAVSQSQGQGITLIGKKGFAPEEQMRHGRAFPCSDLYALAATAIVLLTGKNPEQLYDAHGGKWQWEKEVNVSSHLSKVLNKMLAYSPCDRYQTASDVIEAVNNQENSLVNSWFSHLRTLVVAPKKIVANGSNNSSNSEITTPFQTAISTPISRIRTQAVSASQTLSRRVSSKIDQIPYVRKIRPWQWSLIVATAVIVPGVVTFSVIQKTLFATEGNSIAELSLSRQESAKQTAIYQRVKALKINSGVFYGRVDREFFHRFPHLKGVQLTDSTEHQKYRRQWYQIAEDLLQQQERKH